MYISAVRERSDAAKMYVALLITPFILAVLSQAVQRMADHSAVAGSPVGFSVTAALTQAPEVVRWLFIVVGAAGVVPLQRFLDAHSQMYKMSRGMNNFRLLYRLLLDHRLREIGWGSSFENDPNYPSAASVTHWATMFAILMIFLNCAFVWIGVATLDDSSNRVSAWTLAILYAVFQLFLYANETKLISNRFQPEDRRLRTRPRSFEELRGLCERKELWRHEEV